jgi:dienelactone hydrolase
VETINYTSSHDKTGPLNADVVFNSDGKPKPLLVVMHGYNGSRKDVNADIHDFGAKGLFAIAPDMRGTGGSAGKFDSGGVEIHDILDAVLAALKKYPEEIDAKNLNIVGYSGGGGNTIACAVRFPDLFHTAVSYFGISDYADFHRTTNRHDCNERMERTLGGKPADIPDTYAARNYNTAAANVCATKLHFFWDEEETQCPPSMIEKFIQIHQSAGLKNVVAHISRRGDPLRWIHGYRTGNRDLKEDSLFLSEIRTPKASGPKLTPKGKLIVPGFLVTRKFAVWVEDGQRGVVTIEYDISGAKPIVKVIDNPKKFNVRIQAETALATLP